MDTCIKNGGDHFLAEIASKEFVDQMSGMIRSPVSKRGAFSAADYQIITPEVKQMAVQLFQSWAMAFKSKRELQFLVDAYNDLKNAGEYLA